MTNEEKLRETTAAARALEAEFSRTPLRVTMETVEPDAPSGHDRLWMTLCLSCQAPETMRRVIEATYAVLRNRVYHLSTVDDFLEALGGHGEDPSDIAERVRAFDRAALRAYISACSEEYDCSAWGSGFPEWLWEAMVHDATKMIAADRLATVRMLHERAGGWWHWPEGADGPVFVEAAAWVEIMRRSP